MSLINFRPDSSLFTVGKENILLDSALRKGNVVSFSFENYTRNSAPVNPKVYRIREDISWEEVISNHLREIQNTDALSGISSFIGGL